jgi:transposase
MLPIIYRRVGGLDVHKKTVVATRMRVTDEDSAEWETRTFGTTTPDLLGLHDWLLEWSLSHVAMESTGDYWKPVYNVLEDTFELLVVNAQHVSHVPGRKTDAKDCEWLAELMLHGLLRASFIPPKPQRALREVTRYRTRVIQERTRVVNRVHKVLEGANIKLSSVASDIMGVSARAMLAEIVNGQTDAGLMADLARGRMRSKIPALQKALTGFVEPHHRFLLAHQLAHIDFLDGEIEELSAEITRQMERMSIAPNPSGSKEQRRLTGSYPHGGDTLEDYLTWAEAVGLLTTVPGISQRAAESILAEIGLDMSRFPTDKHLASWAGCAPGNRQSGGKRFSGRRPKGNKALSSVLNQVAHAAARTKGTFLNARYHRLAARRGKKRAIGAISHSIIVSIWHILTHRQPYHDLGADYYDTRKTEIQVSYLVRRLEKLTGATVSLDIKPTAA